MNPIIYTSSTCHNCVKLKNLLNKLGVKYDERDVSDANFLAEIMMLDVETLPVLVLRGTILFGDDLTEESIVDAINCEKIEFGE